MFKVFYFPLAILVSIILISACGDDNPTEPGDSDVTTPNTTLSSIQTNVFTPGCTSSNCHGNSGTKANLNLTSGQSFANLFGVVSQLFPPSKRVDAGMSANSILIKILKGEVSPQMPQNRAKLSDAIIDSIAKWIDNGAMNN